MKDAAEGESTACLAAWTEEDRARALHPADHAAINATSAARALVVELFHPAAPARDLYSSCARLGRLMAERGASPSLASGTIDSAARALTSSGIRAEASRINAARASLLEGYVAVVREGEQAKACSAWDYPNCVVRIDDDAVAIACGLPTVDAEALGAWAGRLAGQLVKAKVRRAVLSGHDSARAEVASALELVGIAISRPSPTETAVLPPGKASWLRLPWRK
jgi:hypothetical protein